MESMRGEHLTPLTGAAAGRDVAALMDSCVRCRCRMERPGTALSVNSETRTTVGLPQASGTRLATGRFPHHGRRTSTVSLVALGQPLAKP